MLWNNSCTKDSCSSGTCVSTNLPKGTVCSGSLSSLSPFFDFLEFFGITPLALGQKICDGNGKCISTVCSQNSDCGNDSWIGNPICQKGR